MDWTHHSIRDEQYVIEGEISLAQVEGQLFSFTLNTELRSRENPEVNPYALYGHIMYDRVHEVLLNDDLNYRFDTLPNGVKNKIRSKVREIVREYIINKNKS